MPFDFGDESINSGDMTIVNCAVTKGDFPLKIVWTLNDKPARDIDGITVDNSKKRVSQLSIDSVQAEHAGKYICTAANRAGSSSHSAVLNVNGTLVACVREQ